MSKTVFLAGASGIIGKRLSKLLLDAGYTVYGTTRTESKAAILEAAGVKPVVVDAFDADKLMSVITEIKPEILLHQLTDLPDGLAADQMEAALVRNARIRDEGTRNLVRAAEAAGVKRFVAQSIGFVYQPSEGQHTEESPLLDFNEPTYGETAKAVHSLEQQTVNGNFTGVVLRNGWLYGDDTGFDAPIDPVPCVHIDAAVDAIMRALECEGGIYNVADNDPRLSSEKFKQATGWNPDFRL